MSEKNINLSKIIDGKKIAEKIKDEIALSVFNIKEGRRPSLAIVLVGERPDSKLYVSLKEKEAKKLGIDTHLYKLKEDISELVLLDLINFLNKDDEVDAILIQLPLPKHLKTNKIIKALDPKKDADGFQANKAEFIKSPVVSSLEYIVEKYKLSGRACIFYRSDIFGNSLAASLKKYNFSKIDLLSMDKFKSQDDYEKNLKIQNLYKKRSKEADLIISAIGWSEFLGKEYLKKGASLIDIGISKKDGEQVKGDLKKEDGEDLLKYYTPVPGGIGPMTIAFLFKNTVRIYQEKFKKN